MNNSVKPKLLNFLNSRRKGQVAVLVMVFLLTLSLVVIVIFNLTSVPSSESLFQSHMQIPSTEIINVGGKSDSELQKAMELYEKQEFSAALPYFDRFLAENPLDQRATFYQSISYLLTGRAEISIPGLIQVAEGFGKIDWKKTAKWYLGLAYLKNNQPEEARQVFKQISSTLDHPFSKEANDILKAF